MPKYTIHAAEEIRDDFDEVERYDFLAPTIVEASNIEEARLWGTTKIASGIPKLNPQNLGSLSSGARAVVYRVEGNGQKWESPLPERI